MNEPSDDPMYSEQTVRLQALVEFVTAFAPQATAGYEGSLADPLRGDHQDDEMVSARALALTAACRAIRLMAERI